MIQKGVAALAVLALVSLASPTAGQTVNPTQAHAVYSPTIVTQAVRQAPAPAAGAATTQGMPKAGSTLASPLQPGPPVEPGTTPAAEMLATRSDCYGGNCDLQQPHIAISTPAPAPVPWLWQEKVSWGANLVLVVLAYVAIIMGLSLLRKIERQGRSAEEAAQTAAEAAQAAKESARAALVLAEAKVRAERPWILVSVRPAYSIENAFTVIAMNRGRGPAQIVSMANETVWVTDEHHLEPTPAYNQVPTAPQEPVILLPDETFDLVTFSRGDVKKICETGERQKRVENWEEKIYLYGKVTYRDLAAPDDAPVHESSWCAWYIHGRQKSGMVMAGPPAYNRHT